MNRELLAAVAADAAESASGRLPAPMEVITKQGGSQVRQYILSVSQQVGGFFAPMEVTAKQGGSQVRHYTLSVSQPVSQQVNGFSAPMEIITKQGGSQVRHHILSVRQSDNKQVAFCTDGSHYEAGRRPGASRYPVSATHAYGATVSQTIAARKS